MQTGLAVGNVFGVYLAQTYEVSYLYAMQFLPKIITIIHARFPMHFC